MNVIIAFVSQKGGVGKSTLARALARELANNNLKVKIADLDHQQGTSTEWHRLRISNNISPKVPTELFSTAADALKEVNSFEALIIDGPARTSTGTLEIARVADLIIQPTGASVDDLRPAIKEFHALVKSGINKNKLVFALNRIGTVAEAEESRQYIEEAGYHVLNGYISDKPAYRKAQNVGYSITETKYSSLNEKADSLMQDLIDKVATNGEYK